MWFRLGLRSGLGLGLGVRVRFRVSVRVWTELGFHSSLLKTKVVSSSRDRYWGKQVVSLVGFLLLLY